jgi:hypothetical protein
MSSIEAAKAIAQHLGVKGKRGGWIYRADGRVLCQGWDAFVILCFRRGWARRHPDPRVGGVIINWRKVS